MKNHYQQYKADAKRWQALLAILADKQTSTDCVVIKHDSRLRIRKNDDGTAIIDIVN